MIDLSQASFVGPHIDVPTALDHLPADLRRLLMLANGFILFSGGLHVRGVCHEPVWHSLDRILTGDSALWRLYPVVTRSDIPFAQDFLGDQYLLRGDVVWQLHAEFGELLDLRCGLNEFLESVVKNPALRLK